MEQKPQTLEHEVMVPLYSIVIPIYNEADSIGKLLFELRGITSVWNDPYEIVIVDDGSTDGSGVVVARCISHWSEGKLIRLNENSGQAAALLCGMKRALGEIIILMDGDGQNDPGDIPVLLEPLKEFDMVVGVRVDRQDSAFRGLMSRSANFVRSRFLKDYIFDSGCGIKAFHREVTEAFIPVRIRTFSETTRAVIGPRLPRLGFLKLRNGPRAYLPPWPPPGVLLITFWIGTCFFGLQTGALAALILVSSFEFFALGRILNANMKLAF